MAPLSADDLILRLRERARSQSPRPPVTEAELRKAETEKLGFPLPPFLRRLYLEIGNGGFGPPYGLLPLFAPSKQRGEEPEGIVDLYLLYREHDLENSLRDPDVEEPDPGLCWPARRLPICNEGCAMYICVDCGRAAGRVWEYDYPGFRRIGASVEAWLERWLHSEPRVATSPPSGPPARSVSPKVSTLGPPLDPLLAVPWFIQQRWPVLAQQQPRLSLEERRQTLAREVAAMFGLALAPARARVDACI